MKAVLVAVNAKYIHSNLGIYCLYAYSREHGITPKELSYQEYTINQNIEDIISDICEEKPDFVGFSCYIWNIEEIVKITRELHKILPQCSIWLGGPEVSYDATSVLLQNSWVTGVFVGEGEESFFEVLSCYQTGRVEDVYQVKGIAVREMGQEFLLDKKGRQTCGEETGKLDESHVLEANIVVTGARECMSLDSVVFPYEDIDSLKNRIVYYETSRGCPYGCSYCLSSVEKNVKFRSMELVKKELQFFLDHKVPQVKFVDRTFNCNAVRTMDIWRYIYEHDNGVTNFHFELSADILTDEEIDYVSHFRPGLVQFEIGVQTTNPQTIQAINRKMNLEKLKDRVGRIHAQRNIHQHLDLIAGLPYEDFDSFHQSFNDVYSMQPDQLQLGFLKVLKGSPMHCDAPKYNIVYQSTPPYEVLYTKWLTYDDIRRLKRVEDMVERYYNSMQFVCTVPFMVQQFGDAFVFFDMLGRFFKERGYFGMQQSRLQNYEIIYEFAQVHDLDLKIVKQLLVYDLYARDNLKKEPEFLGERVLSPEKKEWMRQFFMREEKMPELLTEYQGYNWKQMLRMTHIEWFSFDIISYIQKGVIVYQETIVLFDYLTRDPLSHQAKILYL